MDPQVLVNEFIKVAVAAKMKEAPGNNELLNYKHKPIDGRDFINNIKVKERPITPTN